MAEYGEKLLLLINIVNHNSRSQRYKRKRYIPYMWESDHHHLALKPPERVDYLKFRTVVRMTKQQKSNKQTKSYCKTIHSE